VLRRLLNQIISDTAYYLTHPLCLMTCRGQEHKRWHWCLSVDSCRQILPRPTQYVIRPGSQPDACRQYSIVILGHVVTQWPNQPWQNYTNYTSAVLPRLPRRFCAGVQQWSGMDSRSASSSDYTVPRTRTKLGKKRNLSIEPCWASECPVVKNYEWLNPAWHRMLYSCTHVAPLGVKGLIYPFHLSFQLAKLNTNLLQTQMNYDLMQLTGGIQKVSYSFTAE